MNRSKFCLSFSYYQANGKTKVGLVGRVLFKLNGREGPMNPDRVRNANQGTRIGGGYMVVVYGSGGGSIWIWIGGGIWTRIGGGIWIRIRSGGG